MDYKKTVSCILDQSLGNTYDNLFRAKRAFNGLSEEQLNNPYGESGQTCHEVLQGYQDEHDTMHATMEWFKLITKDID